MKQEIGSILHYLHTQRGFDFRGNHLPMLERRVTKRVHATKTSSFEDYYLYLQENQQELDELLHVLTINVSMFFRDPLAFEYLQSLISNTLQMKLRRGEHNLRIWSAGCSTGEEPYSLAIMIREILDFNHDSEVTVDIIGTDIDEKALLGAAVGQYKEESLKNTRLGLVRKYFSLENEQYAVSEEIKVMVSFSTYDLLDKKSFVPPESVFGDFDIVLCRNVLIYFNQTYQNRIFHKLYKSLHKGGYLILGESEVPTREYEKRFRRVSRYCKIFQKR
jgi:chemotaxis protein methyltransferase CheR